LILLREPPAIAEPHEPRSSNAEAEKTSCSAVRRVGQTFLTLGTLVLLFLAYQVFGTNLVTGRQQQALAADLQETWQLSPSVNVSAPPPKKGEPIGKIEIPNIGVDWIFVEDVEVEDLKKGPGHYPETPLPGRRGNAAIAGHRTTYGAPFNRLDELQQGDEIRVSDALGTYVYRVTEKKIVRPTDLSVVAPTTDSRLTLTTCNPKYSARERLIIVAVLQGEPKI
jgi:sortase A